MGPDRAEVPIINQQSALDELGVGDEFRIGLVSQGTTVRVLPLSGWEDSKTSYFALVLEKELAEGTAVSINLVRKVESSQFDPFAHVDSRLIGDRARRQATAVGSFSNMGVYRDDLTQEEMIRAGFPEKTRRLVGTVLSQKEAELAVAVKVDDAFKGIGVGEDLWVISLAILELLGARARTVKVDATEGAKKGAEYTSFYERMGARRLVTIEKPILGDDLVSGMVLESRTELTAGQFQKLKGVILPKTDSGTI